MKYYDLIDKINTDINTNGEGKITGAKLNDVLNEMVSVLGDGFRIAGEIAPDSLAPADPDNGLCFIATAPGSYLDFGNIQVNDYEIALIYYDGSGWNKMGWPQKDFGLVIVDSSTMTSFGEDEMAEIRKEVCFIVREDAEGVQGRLFVKDREENFLYYFYAAPIIVETINQDMRLVQSYIEVNELPNGGRYDYTVRGLNFEIPSYSNMVAALSAKQNTLTFDTAPTAGSTNPVTSGGIATALGNKADKRVPVTAGNIAKLTADGNIADGSILASEVATVSSVNLKADRVTGATNGNLAALDSSGNLKDSGYKPTDFAAKNKAVPTGGTTGQVLAKKSNNDNDLEWVNQSGGGGTATDVQVNGTSITAGNVANIRTESAYDASTNKIATMSDLPSVPVTDVTVGGVSVLNGTTAQVPAIPTVPTISTDIDTDKADNTKTASPKAVYDEVHPALGSSEPSGGFLPNVVYDIGTLSGNTTFAMAAATDNTILNHWYWMFETPSTAPTITWPAAILEWASGSAPTINASKHYEVSVIDGVACILETGIPTP